MECLFSTIKKRNLLFQSPDRREDKSGDGCVPKSGIKLDWIEKKKKITKLSTHDKNGKSKEKKIAQGEGHAFQVSLAAFLKKTGESVRWGRGHMHLYQPTKGKENGMIKALIIYSTNHRNRYFFNGERI